MTTDVLASETYPVLNNNAPTWNNNNKNNKQSHHDNRHHGNSSKLEPQQQQQQRPVIFSKTSEDGFVREIGVTKSQIKARDLKSGPCNDDRGSQPESGGTNPNPQSKPSSGKVVGVSLLAGKYLMFPEAKKNDGSSKSEVPCLNVQTKEQFTCKTLPRNPNGLAILAAYHRLEESPQFVNQVAEAILTPKTLYLIMPKHYGSVHSYLLEKRNLREAEAANIFKQMVEIVQHCHSKGIVLRDIKLGKFVFADKSKSILKLESLEDATLLMDPSNDSLDDKHGCPNYVSPEKAQTLKTNLRYPGKASDIWCLGVILYTMLSGRYPFNDTNQARLFQKIKSGSFVGLNVSLPAQSMINALLRKSPKERPDSSEILRSTWIRRHCYPGSPEMSENEPERKVVMSTLSSSSSKSIRLDQVVPAM